jgi:hypothetical protein
MPIFINVLLSVNICSCCWKVQTEDWNKAIGSRKSVAPCNYYASSGGKGEILCLTGNTDILYLPCNIYFYMYLNACKLSKASITSFCMNKTATDKAKHLCKGNMFKASVILFIVRMPVKQ